MGERVVGAPIVVAEGGHPLVVDQAAIAQLYPSSAAGLTAFGELAAVYTSPRDRLDDTGRKGRRQILAHYSPTSRRIIFTGAQLLATADDPEAARRSISTAFDDPTLPNSISFDRARSLRIPPLVQPLRHLRALAQQAHAELTPVLQQGVSTSTYHLLKALAANYPPEAFNDDNLPVTTKWSVGHALVALCGIAGVPAATQLGPPLKEGAFDAFVAADILQYAEGRGGSHRDYAKVRQLGAFAVALSNETSDPAEIHERVAALHEHWPAEQRDLIIAARALLAGGLETTAATTTKWITELGFIGVDDREATLVSLVNDAAIEYLSHKPRRTPDENADLLARQARRPTVPATAPKPRTPKPASEAAAHNARLELNTYDPQTRQTVAGVAELVQAFAEATPHSDKQAITGDVNAMLQELKRLTQTQRRKNLKAVPGGPIYIGDQAYTLYKFTPTPQNRSPIGKRIQIFLFQRGDTSYELVGITSKTQKEEEAFARDLRDKMAHPDE